MNDDHEAPGQEPELTRFSRLNHSWSFDGEDHEISAAAYKLHINSTADSVARASYGGRRKTLRVMGRPPSDERDLRGFWLSVLRPRTSGVASQSAAESRSMTKRSR